MVKLLMFHTPVGDSFLYTYGEESAGEGETVGRAVKERESRKFFIRK